MKKPLLFLIKAALFIAVYYFAFYYYAPSDVTKGLWLENLSIIKTFAAVLALFVLKRLIWIFFIAEKGKTFRRIFLTLFLLPSYVFISAFIVITISGAADDKTRTGSWQTNLVFFKDMKIACITAAIDDLQLAARVREPEIVFVPGHLCQNIDESVQKAGEKHPYIITYSNGWLGIPYVVDIIKDPLLSKQ